MKLVSLYAHNFKKLKLDKPLDLPNGIILITGLNESGKSTILDAILYALFGRMIRPSQLPANTEIISYGSGEAQVRLDFQVGSRTFRVIREIHRTRPNRAMLYEVIDDSKTTKTLTTTVRDTTSQIEQLLGNISYNEIVASSVVAQKDLERLIKQRLDDRRKVINVFLNLDSFNRVQETLQAERSRIEGTNRNPGLLILERERLEILLEELDRYNESQSKLSTFQSRVEELRNQQGKLANELVIAENLYKRLYEYSESLRQQDFLKQGIQTKTLLTNDFERQLSNIDQQKAVLEKTLDQIRSYSDLQSIPPILADASKTLEQYQNLEYQKKNLHERQQNLSREIERTKIQLEAYGTPKIGVNEKPKRTWTYLTGTAAFGIATILSLFSPLLFPATVTFGAITAIFLLLLARQISTLSATAQLSESKQQQLANVRILQSMQEESRGIQSSQQEVDQKIQTESQNLSSQLCKIQRYSSIINNASTDPKHTFEQVTTAYNKDKQTLTALEERVLTLQRSVSEETGLRERLNETREEIKLSVEKLNLSNLPELPVGTSYTPALLDETSMRRDELRDSVSRVKTQLEDTTGQIIELKEFLENNKDLQEKVLEQKKTVASLENDLAVVKYAVKGLESTSESLRNRVKPLVERYMSLILPLVTSGNYKAVQLDEDYTVRVFDPEAGEFKPKEVFSGGTEDQLLLAMRLAFALSLTPQAKGSNPEFLFLDEPLGSSDKVRREGIMELLRKELLQSFKQIFLISHVGDLELEADTIITMENGNVREIITRKTEPVPATASVKKSTEPVAELTAS